MGLLAAPAIRRRLSSFGAAALRWFVHPDVSGEQAIMTNRLVLATMVYAAAAAEAHFGGRQARDFYALGLPWLQVYLVAVLFMQAHILLRPEPCSLRRVAAIWADCSIISFGLAHGAAAYLFPLYFWMILGNGVRLGARFMSVAVVSSAAGFAAVVWVSPFWRAHGSLSVGLFLSLIIIPLYGALLLRRLAEASAEAERAIHAKTLMLASVSHELRTPLTAIVGLGELLRKTDLDDKQREMTQTLCDASDILLRHIEALLMVARDEIAEDRAAPERVDLFALLIRLRAMLAVEADRKGVRLGLCVESGVPRFVVAEPRLLLDILQNLGGNAVKFTPSGAVSLHVGVGRRDGDRIALRVEVRDSGIGIDKAAQERIFDSFVQADPAIGRRFGGSGLGLAIARRRLEARGGRLGVESEIGKGALFWFELFVGLAVDESRDNREAAGEAPAPVTDVSDDDDGPRIGAPVCAVVADNADLLALARRFALVALAREGDSESLAQAQAVVADLRALTAAEEAPGREETGSPKWKILLAEDNGVNRMVLERILISAGHEAIAVADGESALQAMLDQSFDVILMDVNMPGLNGVEAARLYQFAQPGARRAPMVALTADASPRCRAQCAEAGMIGWLTKPVAPENLLAAVAAAARGTESEPPQDDGAEAKARPELEAPAARSLERRGKKGDPGSLKKRCDFAESAPIVDPHALDALTKLGGDDFLRSVILRFVEEAGQSVERLARAVELFDCAAFSREAHALASAAGNVGAERLARLCRGWRAVGPERLALRGDDDLEALRSEWSLAALALGEVLAECVARVRAKNRRRKGGRRGDAAA